MNESINRELTTVYVFMADIYVFIRRFTVGTQDKVINNIQHLTKYDSSYLNNNRWQKKQKK